MGGKIPGRIKKDLARRIKRAGKIIIFLDYDGTLAPIRKKPGLAGINKGTKKLLKTLSLKKWARVFIISGRTLSDIKNLIGISSITYSGNHGIELEGPGFKYVNPDAKAAKPYIQSTYRILKRKLKIKGVILENKLYTLSAHYRMAPRGKAGEVRAIFRAAVEDLRGKGRIKITEGKKVLEVRPNVKWHKGKIVGLVLKRIKGRFILPIYIGDDITDEDAFRALRVRGVSILVSRRRRKTRARYRLESPGEVLGFLRLLCRAFGPPRNDEVWES